MNYLKVGKATHLEGGDRKLYRAFEILPGLLSWVTLLGLLILSYLEPVGVAYFIIAFDVYWLLLVTYLGVHLVVSFRKLKINSRVDWFSECQKIEKGFNDEKECLANQGMTYKDVIHIIFLPFVHEGFEVIDTTVKAIADDSFPNENKIIVLAREERAGEEPIGRANKISEKYKNIFKKIVFTAHPDGIEGELKGKGANQAWAASVVKKEVVDKEGYDYNKILVSVFDVDTIISPEYFACATYKFLTVSNPYRASYQPVPVYHNNIWQAPFFARVAANSNTFWQMMQQIRQEKLATYSSHSMTWKALVDVNFWSTNMVSEDSRIFWHCLLHYNGDYRVEPLNYPVSMDATMDDSNWQTAINLYKQQRRWGWGVENVPYLIFNTVKKWKEVDKKKLLSLIWVQVYGFHSWATNALIIGVIGWMPVIIGGDSFNTSVLSGNLPSVTRFLMTLAMGGLVLSAIVSTLLLPKKPKKYGFGKNVVMLLQWAILPFSIIIFGAIPAIEAQTRLMLGKYMGFFVTPKKR